MFDLLVPVRNRHRHHEQLFLKERHTLRSFQAGRWGQGLTAEKMKECVWLRPEAVANFEFLEWTAPIIYATPSSLVCVTRRDPRKVVRET